MAGFKRTDIVSSRPYVPPAGASAPSARSPLGELVRAAVRFATVRTSETGNDLDDEDERLRDAALAFARSLSVVDRDRLSR